MPFLRAGYNPRYRVTGIWAWTRRFGGGRFALARLIRFAGGDYAWQGAAFLAWGDFCVIGTHWSFHLPPSAQYNLPQSDLP